MLRPVKFVIDYNPEIFETISSLKTNIIHGQHECNNKPNVDLLCVINISNIFNLHRIINDKPDVNLHCVITIGDIFIYIALLLVSLPLTYIVSLI